MELVGFFCVQTTARPVGGLHEGLPNSAERDTLAPMLSAAAAIFFAGDRVLSFRARHCRLVEAKSPGDHSGIGASFEG